MKPTETDDAMGPYEIILTRKSGSIVFNTVNGENMAKTMVEAYKWIDGRIAFAGWRKWSYRLKAKPLTPKELKDVDDAIDDIWRQSSKVPFKPISR